MRTLSQTQTKSSPVREDYIRAIYLLQESGTEPGIVEIAKRLNLSKSTVSERIKEMTEDKLTISAPYSSVSLTKKGLEIGKKMTYKHRLIEVFLYKTLHMPKEAIHAEAERLEHAFSDEVIARLDLFLNHPTCDPHGSLLPKLSKSDLSLK